MNSDQIRMGEFLRLNELHYVEDFIWLLETNVREVKVLKIRVIFEEFSNVFKNRFISSKLLDLRFLIFNLFCLLLCTQI